MERLKNMFGKKHLNSTVYILTIVFSILFIVIGNRIACSGSWFTEPQDKDLPESVRARVVQISERSSDSYSMDGVTTVDSVSITFTAKVLSGEDKGEIYTANQTNDSFMASTAKEVEVGDKIVLYYDESSTGDIPWTFGEYIRTDALMLLGILFFLFLLLFGRKKGFNTIIALVFTVLAVFIVFIPSILSGYNIYLWSSIVAIFMIVMTLLIVNGPDRKTLVSMIGCASGVLLAALLTVAMDKILKLTGMMDENTVYLTFLDTASPINLKAIIFAAIILGALGAIMDVAMSLASSLYELRQKAEAPSFKLLMHSGMEIGKDMMGTMSNTLVLAYIGSSLSVVLLLIAYNNNLIELLNKEMIVVEILQTLVGSIAILFTIPFTSFIASFVYMLPSRNHEEIFHEELTQDALQDISKERSWDYDM